MLRSRAPSPLRASRAWHWPRDVEYDVLDACARTLLGEHDFRAFTPAETQHRVFRREVLHASWERRGDELLFRVEADSFLRHMVRTLAGTMLQTAAGERPPEGFARAARGRAPRRGGRDRSSARALPRRRTLRPARGRGAASAQHKMNVLRSTIQECRKAVARQQSEMPPQER